MPSPWIESWDQSGWRFQFHSLYSAGGTLIQQKTLKNLGRLADDGDHGVWAATGHRLLRFSATGQTLVDRIPLNLVITSLVADRTDQSVWVGGVLLLRHIDENGRTLQTTTLLKILRDLALFVVTPQENRPPVAVNDTASSQPNTAISVQVLINDSDPDGDTLKITAVTQGTNGKVTNTDTIVTYTPATGFRGTDTFTYTISDGHGHTATATVTVTVNQAPVITTMPPTSATVGQLYSYDVDATDPGDTLTFALDVAPAGMTINAVSGLIQWTPTGTQVGANNVTVRVRDVGGLFATQSFTVQVVGAPPANRPPVITTAPPTTGTVGQLYSYDVDATDPDAGNILTFSLTTAPTGMTINSVSGLFSRYRRRITWVPSDKVCARSRQGYPATQSFTVQVSPPGNRAPFFTSAPSTTATVGQLYSYDADASDPDAGDTLTFSLTVAPSGMTDQLKHRPDSMDSGRQPGRRQQCHRACKIRRGISPPRPLPSRSARRLLCRRSLHLIRRLRRPSAASIATIWMPPIPTPATRSPIPSTGRH